MTDEIPEKRLNIFRGRLLFTMSDLLGYDFEGASDTLATG